MLALLGTVILFQSDAGANGATAHQGIYGSEITIEEEKPSESLVVDESVTIDVTSRKILVAYKVINQSDKINTFEMIFPVEGFGQGNVGLKNDSSLADYLDFHVTLNGLPLHTREVPKSEVHLDEGYRVLDDSVAMWILFPVQLKPGPNEISIDYRLLMDGGTGDGIGEWCSAAYSIWPAKNWVSRFRTASWRVIVSTRSDLEFEGFRYVHEFDDWYTTNFDADKPIWVWRKGDIAVAGPGERHDYPDRVEFTAIDYPPQGQLSVRFRMLQLSHLVAAKCRRECVETYLSIHPYMGDKRCYRADDLMTEPGYMELTLDPAALPFLRNEIFARKGHQFSTPVMKEMFARMPWYQQGVTKVELNDIEKWNVNAIAALEKHPEKVKEAFGSNRTFISVSPCPNDPYDMPLPPKAAPANSTPIGYQEP